MTRTVIKRTGEEDIFNKRKIYEAALAAFISVDGEESEYAIEKCNKIADYVETVANNSEVPLTVEQIQDFVYEGLCNCRNKKVAEAFAIYREDRNRARMGNTDLIKEIGEKLFASNVQNQNANVDEASFGGRKGEAANELCKFYALNFLMSPLARERHLNNQIYTHDLDSYAVGMHNCLTIPFDDLLKNGFNTRQCSIRTPSGINTALQLVAVIFQLQSLQQFGGAAASHLDWTLVPYLRKTFAKYYTDGYWFISNDIDKAIYHWIFTDELKEMNLSIDDPRYKFSNSVYEFAMMMTERELYQSVEALYHNLNTLQSRSGNQLPFTSINYGTCTLPEGRMIIKALLDCSIKGVGKVHTTPIFPCGIFKLKKGINRYPGDPNYDLFQLALKSTSLRLYPNYANCDWSVNKGYNEDRPSEEVATMG